MYKKTDHIKIIAEIARGMAIADKLHNYLELGIAKAHCFKAVSKYAHKSYAVDIDPDCLLNIPASINDVARYAMSSDDFFKHNSTMFDLVFIDGLHQFAQVKKDFINAWKWLSLGGLIIMHDTYPPSNAYKAGEYCGDVYLIIDYLRTIGVEFVTLPVFYGLTIVRKV